MKILSKYQKKIPIFLYLGFLLLTILSTIVTKKANLLFNIEPIQFLFYRTLICFFILLPIAFYKKFALPKKKDSKYLFNTGLYMFTIYLWYFCLKTIPINSMTVIGFIVPIVVNILAALFLQEDISKNVWFTVLICFLSVFFINYTKIRSNTGSFNEYIYAILFTLIRSTSVILSKKSTKQKTTEELLYYLALTGLLMAPFMFLILPFKYVVMNQEAWIMEIVNTILYILQMWMMYKAYSMTKVSRLQSLDFFKFIFSAILSFAILKESPTAFQVSTAIVIFLTNLLFLRDKKK